MADATVTTEGIATMGEIREDLTKTLRGLSAGEISPAVGNAICNTSGKILSSVKLEMEYHKMVGKMPNIPMLNGAQQDDVKPTG